MTTITTPRGFKLGKLDPVASPFKPFKAYLAPTPAAQTQSQAHYGGLVRTPWQMDGNGPDPEVTLPGVPPNWPGAGDCVAVGKRNLSVTSNYTAFGQVAMVPTPNDVVSQYCVDVNCTPEQLFTDPDQYDTGEDITTSLTKWCTTEEYGDKLGFTAQVDPSSQGDVLNGLFLGGGLLIGLQLRENNEQEFPGTWTWNAQSQVIGGHCVELTGYDLTRQMAWLVTWGQLIGITFQCLFNSMDEAHVYATAQAIAAGKGPTGLLLPAWQADLDALN